MLSDQTLSQFAINSKQNVLAQLNSSEQGLSEKEAQNRLIKYGQNILIQRQHIPWIIEYIATFKNPLVLILLFASVAAFVLGDKIDALIIASIVLLSTLLNFTQEYSANKAAEKLKEKVATTVTVLRDNKELVVKMADVCIGDIVTLSAGNLVPADCRLISVNDCFVNQAALTGEPYPIEKTDTAISSHSSELDSLVNIVFSGSSVVSGDATAVVVKTGKDTEFGKIGKKLTEAPLASEFTTGIKNLSYLIMRTTIVFVLFIFFFNTIIKHTPVFDSFTFAVALAVGLTPELLPMIMSITMSKGSLQMAKKGAIVKRLVAIPNFGSMDVLCTDKTGTLTDAHIELVKYIDILGDHSEKVLLNAYLNSFFQTGVKNPMDEAVIRFKREDIHQYKKIDEIPFDFERKRTSIVIEHAGKHILITKGAPEEVFKVSRLYEDHGHKKKLTQHATSEITKVYKDLSQQGFRVLAIAGKPVEVKKQYTIHDEEDLALMGYVAFLDPAKKDVKEVLQRIVAMGIEPKIISGDNELVTQKICEDIELTVKGVLLGSKMSSLTDDALRVIVEKRTIFARFSPEQKNRVITALRKNKHVVGYMGDGINDAPSLKEADVGISVSNAVDVAKEAADIILTHKSLKELEEGILEGRKTFANTMKYIMMGFSSNFGNMFSVLGAVFIVPFLPMLSIQILLNNLLYDFSQVTIPSDHVDHEFIQQPRRWDITFIRNFMLVFGPLSSVFDYITFFTLAFLFAFPEHLFQTGWFLESLATQTLVIHIIRTRHTPFLQSSASKYVFATTLGAVIVGWIIPYTKLGTFFHFAPLPLYALVAIIMITIGYLLLTQIVKEKFYKHFAY